MAWQEWDGAWINDDWSEGEGIEALTTAYALLALATQSSNACGTMSMSIELTNATATMVLTKPNGEQVSDPSQIVLNPGEASCGTYQLDITGTSDGTFDLSISINAGAQTWGITDEPILAGETKRGQIVITYIAGPELLVTYLGSSQPAITLITPSSSGDTADDLYEIRFEASDIDNPDAEIHLFYDNNNIKNDGNLGEISHPEGIRVDGPKFFLWDTSAVTPGAYYIYAVINDGTGSAESYSEGTVTISPDGIPKSWEETNGLNPYLPDGDGDYDGDTLTNLEEYNNNTDPWDWDTDHDGLPDGWEVTYGLDPAINADDSGADGDPDVDNLTNLEEYNLSTHPNKSDTDEDGLSDGDEVLTYQTDPTIPDTDHDGLSDGEEASFWDGSTHPRWDEDIDGDGLANIIDPDSDNDGYSDGQESGDGTDPGDPYSPATGVSSTGVVKLVDSYSFDIAVYQGGETVYLLLLDADLNTDATSQEVAEVQITSNTDDTGEAVTLIETSADTGVFTGSIALNDSGSPVDGQLDVTSGDTITVIYQDASDDWGNPGVVVDTAVYSATVVSGPISEETVWTLANSPYLVTGDVTVNEGVTLSIEPGVKVMFLANSDDQESGWGTYDSELIVYGTLVAQGTSSNRIVFTSSDRNPEPNDWYGIIFSNGEGTIEHCQIEYGYYGIYLQNASPNISSNIISNNADYGIYCQYSNPLIEGNTISNNDSGGIYCNGSSPTIDNNQISNNNGMGIYCYSWSASSYASPQISNNTISGSNYGIYCYSYSTPSITSNTISDNRYDGIYCYFYDANADASQTISGNIITGNNNGIILYDESSPTINQNNLYGNTNYDIQNNTQNEIDAKNNRWGDAAYAEMEAGGNPKDMPTIYDYYNNTSYGMVNYSGWLNEEALFPPPALTGISGNGVIYLNWTPVVAAVGYKVYYGTSSGTYEESVDAGNTTKDFAVEGLINNTTYYIVVTAYDGNGNESGYSAQIKATPTLSGGTMGFISFDRKYYNLTDTAVITLSDGDLNMDPGSIQNVDVQVISDSDTMGVTITLAETDLDSGVFTSAAFGNDLGFTSEDSDDVNKLIRVADGDTVTVVYNDLTPSLTRTAKAMIDDSAPETTLTPSGDLYYDGQDYYAPISFSYSLSATDSYSGVERIEYSIDGSPFVEFKEAFTLDSEGSHTINHKALDNAGNWEETKTSDIIVDNTPPAEPTGLSGSQVNFQVNLSWNVNSEADFLGYNIYRDGTKINTELRTWTNYSDLIVSGKTYVYNVTGVDRVGNESAFSEPVSISTVSTAPAITDPHSGTFFADSEITVRGTAEPGATVEIFVDGVSQGTTVASSTGYFSLSGVQISEGENSITAISTNAYGETSPVSSAVTVPLDPRPQPPVGLVAAAGDTVVTITWDPNPEADVQGYHIYRDGTRLNYSMLSETIFTDTRLTNGRAYIYTVTAVDTNGSESDRTSSITVTPVAGPEWEIP